MPQHAERKSEKGQILLIVVLASVIALTVGLAAISRNITNTRISTEEANSQKALAAAEAGVEEQLNKIIITSPSTKTLSNNSNFNASATPLSGQRVLINNGSPIRRDEGADIWLSTYPGFGPPLMNNTRLTIYWNGTGNCSTEPAIEVALIYGDRTNPSMERFTADQCRGARGNNFSTPGSGGTINGISFNRSLTFPSGNIVNGYIARVIPLYADAPVMAVETTNGSNLPSQGHVVSSTGTSGDTVRKVRVFQGFPRLPIEFFPYNLFLP